MSQTKGPNGIVAKVTDDGDLNTFSITQREDKALNKKGNAFSIHFTVTPTGANDFFFYMKNNGLGDIFVIDVNTTCTVATKLYYQRVVGNAVFVTGTDASVTNLNLGNATQLNADTVFDTDITGLTPLGILGLDECGVSDRGTLQFRSNVIIPQGQAIAFQRVEATGTIDCVVNIAVGQ